MNRSNRSTTTLLVVTLALATTVSAEEDTSWGNLSGRFLYDGVPPMAKAVTVTHDKDAFREPIFDESVVVHPTSSGLANVMVYLLPADGDAMRVHPSYEETAKDKLELSMHKGRFKPHMLLLRTTQTMVLQNYDEVAHNPKTNFSRNDAL